jgi:chromosome segregation protein
MLKTLQLTGFKSFADKTEFHFSPGITGIVGPNGSGKSNIVDSVRWVLGEQSAKSLRGGEMADVIFNGSASRRSFGMAEVTMVFDNTRRALATEADEVQITRRVYRSGEGEYLINGQPSRLRDIKQLFLGSGAGTDAYCIIEQGRVDVLLQATTRERRTIFEEAAGISRFKAKKIETLRRLERVDQNVQRLKDIIEEVEKQLRSVKLQAAKAQRYQEHAGRLKELRIGLGLQEYGEVAKQLADETAILNELRTGLEEQSARAEVWERETARVEAALSASEDAAREQESRLGTARQQIAAEETTLTHEASLTGNLEAELGRTRAGLADLDARVAALADAANRLGGELQAAETQGAVQRQGVRTLQDELQRVILRLGVLHSQVEAEKKQHFDQMRQAGHLQNDAVSHKALMDNLIRERERRHRQSEQAAATLASVDLELQELTEADEGLQARLTAARQALANQRQEREQQRQRQEQMTAVAADLRERRSGLASRIEVLEGLERSQEGVGTGAREALELVNSADPGPWRTVVGMVADLLTVRHEYAPLIDLALGERAQRFVVRDALQLHEALARRGQPFSGRVSFLTLTAAAGEPGAARSNRLMAASPLGEVRMPASPEGLPDHSGVVALAENLVTCDNPELADLPAQLLRRTLIVRDLDAARTIAAFTTGYRFVTLRGELLEPDGTLTVGTHHAEASVLSRKSELRDLRGDVGGLDQRIAEAERHLGELRERLAAFDSQMEESQREIDALGEQAADLHQRLGQHRERRATLQEEVADSKSEISGLDGEIQDLRGRWEQACAAAARAEQLVQELHLRIQANDHELRERETQRDQFQEECTAAKVALAQAEERLAAQRAKHQQTAADLEQRRQEQRQAAEHLASTRARLFESQQTMLQASSALAQWYLDKEAAEARLAQLISERDRLRTERQQLLEQSQSARAAWRAQQEQAHARELQVNDLRHRRDTLVERLREDYQVDLATLYQEQQDKETRRHGDKETGSDPGSLSPCLPVSLSPQEANEEIAELRRKLARLGAVNMEALQELAELETRAASLQAQYDDLAEAKRSLEEIIAKINEDSRKLFIETFNAIRTNFQELFRKLFGGGMADIVLEDENDILECGIEIIARPPGKELRSISLMSGGEKTLTAVALLLAIFRSKPSPFCILDEVDAALDEANIGRFTAVLRDFLDRSHFIIVTHSKRTMSVCDVLYGITMQESGISKRVAVRFEDWPDEGAPTNGQAAAANDEEPLGSVGGGS